MFYNNIYVQYPRASHEVPYGYLNNQSANQKLISTGNVILPFPTWTDFCKYVFIPYLRRRKICIIIF